MMKRLLLLSLLFMGHITNIQALVIGTTAHYPPLASLANKQNQFVGFEIDIMNAICQRIKQPCEYKALVVSTIPAELLSRKIDLAIAGIMIPQTSEPGYIFSLPYLASDTQLIALKSSNINVPADIEGKTIGLRRGVIAGGNLLKNFASKLYRGNVQVQDFKTNDELMDALNKQDINVAFMNAVAADYWVIHSANMYKRIGGRIPIGNGYGVMANQGQEALVEKINQALLSMMADGSYVAIYSLYF
jgi:glutamine transport system substrate-binding protein